MSRVRARLFVYVCSEFACVLYACRYAFVGLCLLLGHEFVPGLEGNRACECIIALVVRRT